MAAGFHAGSAAIFAPNNARIGGFRIADDAGFVKLVAGKSCISGRRDNLVAFANEVSARALFAYLPPFLRRVILIRQPPLGEAFDFQRVGLCAVVRTETLNCSCFAGLA